MSRPSMSELTTPAGKSEISSKLPSTGRPLVGEGAIPNVRDLHFLFHKTSNFGSSSETAAAVGSGAETAPVGCGAGHDR